MFGWFRFRSWTIDNNTGEAFNTFTGERVDASDETYEDEEGGKVHKVFVDPSTGKKFIYHMVPVEGKSFMITPYNKAIQFNWIPFYLSNSSSIAPVASNDVGHYLEGSYSFDKTFVHYMPNVGLLGSWSNVRGSANVSRGKNGKYYAKVSATGYTPASLKGTTTYSGGIDVIVGSTVVNSYSLIPSSGPSLMRGGRQDVGNATFLLPDASGDVFLRFNVGYTYSEGIGADVPYPTQGHYQIQIGFSIDGWTY